MTAAPRNIPYEKQTDTQSTRTCGAACLAMVYRSFGKALTQEEIWPAIAKVNRFGSKSSTTHLMTQHALGQGLHAVAFQARHPIQALRLCNESGARAILNHRAEAHSPNGHYSVMVDLDARNVYLHDPFYGPSRSISHADLLELWQPKFPNSEIVGGVLIAIVETPMVVPPCQFCRTPMAPGIECPHCRKPVALKPGTVLGCMNENCIARMWNYICCPSCDFMWNSSGGVAPHPSPADAMADSAAPGSDPPEFSAANLAQMNAALDKFLADVSNIPGALQNNMIKQQLDILAAQRAMLPQALAEVKATGQALQAQLASFVAASAARGEAHRQKLAEMEASKPKPAQSLDGVALGKALLKNLGFTQ